MAFDAAREVTIMVGGFNSPFVWELGTHKLVADVDGDCDVDLRDFAEFQDCRDHDRPRSRCRRFDRNRSGDLDTLDFVDLIMSWGGPSLSRTED